MPDLSTITPVTREEEFLDRIARAAASPNLPEVDTSDNGDVLTVVSGEWAAAAPASCLPEVTSSNNGQVLTVVSGEWAAAAPAGGGALLVGINTTQDEDEVLDKTAGQIISALPLAFIYNAETDGGSQYFGYLIMNNYVISDGTAQDLPPTAGYYFTITVGGMDTTFYAATLNDYPEALK